MDENAEEKREIFIDSNIFLYSYSIHKLANCCRSFLLEVEEGRFKGFVNPIVVDEVFYKSIVAEVMTKKNIPLRDISSYIKSNPSVLKTLKNPYEIVEDILSWCLLLFSLENLDLQTNDPNFLLKLPFPFLLY